MPLVSTGDAQAPLVDMMEALFTAAVNWLAHGLPLRRLLIVERSPLKAAEMKGAFSLLKKRYLQSSQEKADPHYDLFVSYSHQNTAEANFVVTWLKQKRPDLRIFIDQTGLEPGAAWQEKLYRAIDDSRKVLVLYSPPYLCSKACQEEYNIARVLHMQSGNKTLFPIFLYSADLPAYMMNWQYLDCREGDFKKLNEACEHLLEQLG